MAKNCHRSLVGVCIVPNSKCNDIDQTRFINRGQELEPGRQM